MLRIVATNMRKLIFLLFLCTATRGIAAHSLDGKWMLAGGGCSDETPKAYPIQGGEVWRFNGNTFSLTQEKLENAEDPSCQVQVYGTFTLRSEPNANFRIYFETAENTSCIIIQKKGRYTLRVPMFNRLTTYQHNTATRFRFGEFLGAEALVEEITHDRFKSCREGRYSAYFIRTPMS